MAVLGAFSALFAGGGVKKASGQFGMSISNQVRVQGSEQAASGESNAAAPSDFNLQSEVNKQLLIEKAGAEAGGVSVTPAVSPAVPAGTVVSNAPSAPAPSAASTYTVKSGDTLWKIAETQYGQGEGWTNIWQANRADISEPDLIYPGQKLSISPISGEKISAQIPIKQTTTAEVASADAQIIKNSIKPRVEALNKSLGQLAVSVNQYAKNNQDNKIAVAAGQVAAYSREAEKSVASIASASSRTQVIDSTVNLLAAAKDAVVIANQMSPVGSSAAQISFSPRTGGTSQSPSAKITIPIITAAVQTSLLSQTAGEQVRAVNTAAASDAVARIEAVAAAIVSRANSNNVALPTVPAKKSAELAAASANRAEEAVVIHQPGSALMQTIIATNAAIAANVTEPGSQMATSASASAAKAITALQSVNPAEMQHALSDYQISGGGGESGPSGVGSSPDVGTGPGTTYSGGIALGNTGITLGGNLGAAGQTQGPVSSAIQGVTGIGPLGQSLIGLALGAIPGVGIGITVAQGIATGIDSVSNTITNSNIAAIANEIQSTVARNVEDISQTTPNPTYSGISNPLGNLSAIGVTGSGLQGIDAAAASSLSSGIGIGGAGSIGYSGTIASVANVLGISQISLIGQLAQAGKLSPEQAAKLMSQVDEDTTNQTVDPVVSMVDTEEGLQDTSDAVGAAAAAGIAAAAAAATEAVDTAGMTSSDPDAGTPGVDAPGTDSGGNAPSGPAGPAGPTGEGPAGGGSDTGEGAPGGGDSGGSSSGDGGPGGPGGDGGAY